MTFNTAPFAWDVDLATRDKTVGNATMCVSMIKLDYMKREDLVLNLKLDAYRFDQNFIVKYYVGPCFSLDKLKELKEGELVRFDPQLEVGGETYEDVTAIDYDDMLFITVIPNNFEYYLWKQEASLRQAELSIFLNRTERYNPPDDPNIIPPEASLMGIILAILIVVGMILYGLFILIKKAVAAI